MARNSSRGRNNNPAGRSQYSSDWMDMVKERPIAAAAVAAASVGAGVFLWSKRNALSDQMSNLSSQISDWTENFRSSGNEDFEMVDNSPSGAATGSTSSRTSRSTGSRRTSTSSPTSSGSPG